MKFRTIFESYCSLVSILSLPFTVYFLVHLLINSYYILNPKAAFSADFTVNSQVSFKLPKFKVPEGCPSITPDTEEEFQAQKKRQYDIEVLNVKYFAKHEVRSSVIYLLLLLMIFFGHLFLLIRSNAKNT